MNEASESVEFVVDSVRSRSWALGAVCQHGDSMQTVLDLGQDVLDVTSVFPIGSVSKTVTALILASALERAEIAVDSVLGDVLAVQGPAESVSLIELATHRSGLPRLPPTMDLDVAPPSDPYSMLSEQMVLDGLTELALPDRGSFGYSNFGFMVLALALENITGESFERLVTTRVFGPLQMPDALCPMVESSQRIAPVYMGSTPVQLWHEPVLGAGGIGMSIRDLQAFLGAHVDPPDTEIGHAIVRASTCAASGHGLGWAHQGGAWIHDGATSGSSSFVGFHRPSRVAVGLVANGGRQTQLTAVGIAALTRLARADPVA